MAGKKVIFDDTDLTIEIPMWKFQALIEIKMRLKLIEDVLMKDNYADKDLLLIAGIQDEWNMSRTKLKGEEEA